MVSYWDINELINYKYSNKLGLPNLKAHCKDWRTNAAVPCPVAGILDWLVMIGPTIPCDKFRLWDEIIAESKGVSIQVMENFPDKPLYGSKKS